jgi:hypothetical protein
LFFFSKKQTPPPPPPPPPHTHTHTHYTHHHQLTDAEWKVLNNDVACKTLVGSVSEYKAELESAGFKVREATDVTADWRQHTADRVAKFTSDREKLEPILGECAFGLCHSVSMSWVAGLPAFLLSSGVTAQRCLAQSS